MSWLCVTPGSPHVPPCAQSLCYLVPNGSSQQDRALFGVPSPGEVRSSSWHACSFPHSLGAGDRILLPSGLAHALGRRGSGGPCCGLLGKERGRGGSAARDGESLTSRMYEKYVRPQGKSLKERIPELGSAALKKADRSSHFPQVSGSTSPG